MSRPSRLSKAGSTEERKAYLADIAVTWKNFYQADLMDMVRRRFGKGLDFYTARKVIREARNPVPVKTEQLSALQVLEKKLEHLQQYIDDAKVFEITYDDGNWIISYAVIKEVKRVDGS